MKFDPSKHHRRSIRLRGCDYAQAGAYFITICTQDRLCLFKEITDNKTRVNNAGKMIHTVWDEIPVYYPGIDIDAFVVMPNHIHGIIIVGAAPRGRPAPADEQQLDGGQLVDGENAQQLDGGQPLGDGQQLGKGQPRGVAPTGLSLSDIVQRFKTMTTKRYIDGVEQNGWTPFPGKLWQRNYWEHIIRNEAEWMQIQEYIESNPLKWELDKLHPANIEIGS